MEYNYFPERYIDSIILRMVKAKMQNITISISLSRIIILIFALIVLPNNELSMINTPIW